MRRSLVRAMALLAVAVPFAVEAASSDEVQGIVRQSTPLGSYLAGQYASGQRDVLSASAFLRSALSGDSQNRDLLDRTFRSMLAAGEVGPAMAIAEQLAREDPTNRIARLTLAIRDIRARQYAAARERLAGDVEAERADLNAVLVSAWALYGANDAGKAMEVLGLLGGSEFENYMRDLHMGLIADAAGMPEEAGKRLQSVYQLDPQTFLITDAYGSWLTRAGRWDDARGVYQTFAEAFPGDPRAVSALADVEQKRRRRATIRTGRAGIAEVLFTFGRFANSPATAEAALIYVNLALHLEPDHELALLTLASLSESTGQPQAAINAYERLPARSIYRRDAELQIAINLMALEDYRAAQLRLEALIARSPKDLDAHLTLGNLLHRQERYEDAARAYSRAIAAAGEPQPQHWRLYFARAVSQQMAKRWPQAEADLKQALQLAPDEPILLNYLGYSWIDRGVHLEEGLRMIRQAVDARPNDGDIADSLGWAYYRLGRYDEAVEVLERAVEIKAQSWEINDHLGDAYWKVGRRLEARFQWAHAREQEPTAEAAPLIDRKLAEGLDAVEPLLEAHREQVYGSAGGEAQAPDGAYVVKPGDSIWNIAKAIYGDSGRYVDIIRANQGILRNPDIIHPGQRLDVPGR